MVQIQNADAVDAIKRGAGLTISEGIPQNLLSNVQPVLDMTPRFHRTLSFFKQTVPSTSASSNTAYTTETDRRTFITGIQFGFIKDATCDAANSTFNVRITINNVITTVASIQLLTLTAQSEWHSIQFKYPIEVTPGGVLQITQPTFTAGSFSRVGTFMGYQLAN